MPFSGFKSSRGTATTEIPPEDYPGEVKKCITELRQQRTRLVQELGKLDHDRKKLQSEIRIMTDKLAKISSEQAHKMEARIELEKTISETEQSYARLIETSKGLYKTVNETKKSIPARDIEYSSRTDLRARHTTGNTSPSLDTQEDYTSPPLSSTSGVQKTD